MLQGHDLIYFGPGRWDGLWRNRHHLLSRFARCNRVLYVEPATDLRTFRELWRTGRMGPNELWRELRQSRLTQLQPNLYIYHSPTYLPVSGRFPLNRLTWQVWTAALRATLRRFGFHRPLLWLSRPEMAHLIGRFAERLVIYHVVDEYTAYQSVTPEEAQELRAAETQMLRRADLVVVVSPQLLEAKQAFNSHTYLVPNGVDTAAFEISAPVPTDLQPVPAPRLVYAGLIGARLDLKLLMDLMRRRPDWSLVLIGQENPTGTAGKLEELHRLANVYFLGLKPAQQVPAYLLACSVCLLPYARNREAHYIDPLKLYEGLAAGMPVVATPIPALRPHAGIVRLAESVADFELAVESALAERRSAKAAELARRRRGVAAANTWEMRVEKISALIEAKLGANGICQDDETAISRAVY